MVNQKRKFLQWVLINLLMMVSVGILGWLCIVALQPLPVFTQRPPARVALTPLQDIAQIAAGNYHACALTSSGGVKCWGRNYEGQLGDGTKQQHRLPVAVVGLSSGVIALGSGQSHVCALTTGGGVKCWGWNAYGQLGDGSTTDSSIPINIISLDNGVSAITGGDHHTCAIQNGGVQCWGDNYRGQLGDGTTTARKTPVAVAGLSSGVTALSAGAEHTCAVTSQGGVQCWGNNDNGQLGDGTTTERHTPVTVFDRGVKLVVTGGNHTCALLNTGAVKCWGGNGGGQVGDGSTNNRLTPVDVVGLSNGVNALAAGHVHTCALTASGGLKCWGQNIYAQVGDDTQNDRLTPVDVPGLTSGIRAIATGGFSTCAVAQAGTVQCWGYNGHEQLGDGLTADPITPVNVVGLTNDVNTLAAGGNHTCSLMNSGGVKCWGRHWDGELGDGVGLPRKAPFDVVGLPALMQSITAGDNHTCALTNSGGALCWGANSQGQLGNGDTTSQATPVNVLNLASGVKMVSAYGEHTCAVTSSDAVQCWGRNADGELGDGTTNSSNKPVVVTGLSSGVSAVVAGHFHTCALLQNNQVKCWGYNADGRLGDGTTTSPRLTPVTVTGLSGPISAIVAGGYHTCALLSTGGVKCWGTNWSGQLGNGDSTNQATPVDVVGLQSGVRALALGENHSCALTSNGGVKCWGENLWGQLGDGTTLAHVTPRDVAGLTSGVRSLTAGNLHTCAVLTAGGAQCWGLNGDGQLGDGSAWRGTPALVMEEGATPATPTPTFTPTATTTTTATPSATPSTPPPADGDANEPDNTCDQAKAITVAGVAQTHTFGAPADIDWLRFDATQNVTYRIEMQAPAGSPADVNLEVYQACDQAPVATQNKAFTPGVRLDFTASSTGPLFLKLNNTDATVAGAQVSYQVTVQARTTAQVGALIIVAGRYKLNDQLQENIHNVTDQVYALFQAHGYTDDRIDYLATDPTRPGYDLSATKNNLHAAIVTWAADKVSSDKGLTLYLMDHGDQQLFYLDAVHQEQVTSAELDAWLTELETKVPGVKINVIIEACNSGSFLTGAARISKPNRVIITSTSADALAYASATGARFSDYLLTSLKQGDSLDLSFRMAQFAVRQVLALQQPWLDGDGDGVPNEPDDDAVAAQRSLSAATLDNDQWPPYIVRAQPPSVITNRRGVLQATVRDDKQVHRVWAVIYPPSYTPPTTRNELVPETVLPTVVLQAQGNDRFAAEYPGFDEIGHYRIVVYAEDGDGLVAAPIVLELDNGSHSFLPLVRR